MVELGMSLAHIGVYRIVTMVNDGVKVLHYHCQGEGNQFSLPGDLLADCLNNGTKHESRVGTLQVQ
jgi:hypothetical protein